MKSFSWQGSSSSLAQAMKDYKDVAPQVIILFSSREELDSPDLHDVLRAAFPQAQVIGCSTAGEIGDTVDTDSISLIGMHFEKSTIRCVSALTDGPESMATVGAELGAQLKGEDLAGVFVLSPGVDVNGSQLTRALKNNLPEGVSISGGLAGDGLAFTQTLTLFDGKIVPNMVVALGIYGKDAVVRSGSQGGWKPFGPLRRVTRAKDNILYEIDGSPALSLYKQYLGDKAVDLPSSGLLYPFAIMQKDGNSAGLIRTILNIDEEAGSLILAGDMEAGQLVCLMHGNIDELAAAAGRAAQRSSESQAKADDCAVICVSCVGRKILMGDDTEEELDAVREVFGDSALAGFYSYGEIALSEDTRQAELHNQTMTVTCISESA